MVIARMLSNHFSTSTPTDAKLNPIDSMTKKKFVRTIGELQNYTCSFAVLMGSSFRVWMRKWRKKSTKILNLKCIKWVISWYTYKLVHGENAGRK